MQTIARPSSQLGALAGRATVHNSTRFCSMQRVANIPRFALHVRNSSRRNRCQIDPQLCTKPLNLELQVFVKTPDGWVLKLVCDELGGIEQIGIGRWRYDDFIHAKSPSSRKARPSISQPPRLAPRAFLRALSDWIGCSPRTSSPKRSSRSLRPDSRRIVANSRFYCRPSKGM